MTYRMQGVAKDEDIDFDVVVTTHPAQPGTYVVYAHRDGTSHRVPVILWGVLLDGSPVPITLDGVWDDTGGNPNKFVLFPDGRCGAFEENWDTLEAAIAEKGKLERQ
jgi:hypothetical protein